jgi:glycosyltransferase involved in cell wall biosynthesis
MNITYVVPTLNSAATLDMTLLSLHSQRDVKVNIIVVDSGSTDATKEICQRWQVPVAYAEPGNMYRAINVGLRTAQTDWLGYINSDDWLYPNNLAKLIRTGEDSDTDIVYGSCDFVDENGRFMYSFSAPAVRQLPAFSQMGIVGFTQQSTIFRRHIFESLKGFNESYFFAADTEFYLRAVLNGSRFSLVKSPPIACFRLHANQQSQTKSDLWQVEANRLKQELGQPNLRAQLEVLRWRVANTPEYLLRFLRQSLLANRITINPSIHSGGHMS